MGKEGQHRKQKEDTRTRRQRPPGGGCHQPRVGVRVRVSVSSSARLSSALSCPRRVHPSINKKNPKRRKRAKELLAPSAHASIPPPCNPHHDSEPPKHLNVANTQPRLDSSGSLPHPPPLLILPKTSQTPRLLVRVLNAPHRSSKDKRGRGKEGEPRGRKCE
jgi:hypothetical protein